MSPTDIATLREIAFEGASAYAAAAASTGRPAFWFAVRTARALAEAIPEPFDDAGFRAHERRRHLARTLYGVCRCGVRGTPEKPNRPLTDEGAFWCHECLMGRRA